jgi:Flp pilus assembly protein TadD
MRSGIRAAAIGGLMVAASLTISAGTPQSESGEIQLQLARQFLADGRYQDALEAFQAALTATVPADGRATRTGIVQAALRVAEFDIARTHALQLVKVAPADPEAATLYGDALWASGLF